MNRTVSIVMIALGVGFHVHYCQWQISESIEFKGDYGNERVIFARHSSGYESRRSLPNHVVLLARPGVDKKDAPYYGLLIPGLFIGFALLMWRLEGVLPKRRRSRLDVC